MATKKKTKTTNRSTKVKAKAKAKPAPKKKKTPTKKKKVAKKVANLHVGKRYFRIELAGYGGELVVGRASDEFIEYWSDEDRKNLLADHMHAMSDICMYSDDMLEEAEEDEITLDYPEGFDKDSPEVYVGSGNREYWDFDDIEHDTMLNPEYTQYIVTEITPDPRTEYSHGELSWQDSVTKKRNFDWSSQMFTEVEGSSKEYDFNNCVVDRELYLDNDKDNLEDPVPVIMMYDSQKGVFGHIIVQTNGEDFDPNKFAYASISNTMSNGIQSYYYNKQSLAVDNSDLSTWGKGFHASVGYVEKQEIEYDYQALLAEGWKNLEEA